MKRIIINNELLEKICRHAGQSYPYECCGIITGRNRSLKEALDAHQVANLNRDRTHDRYELDPQGFQKIDARARAKGLSVLGFYHSHPDHPSEPSEFDTQRAWEGYSYLIVSVEKGKAAQVQSWTLNEQGQFTEEKIVSNGENHSKE